jgi:hypothetical protein
MVSLDTAGPQPESTGSALIKSSSDGVAGCAEDMMVIGLKPATFSVPQKVCSGLC